MTQQIINIGAAEEDRTGDGLRVAGAKINDNNTELYAQSLTNDSVLSVGVGQRFTSIQAAVNYALTRAQFSSTALAGTVSVSLDGKTVTGVGTNFLTAFAIRKYISFGSTGKYYAIKSVASDTTLRLVSPFKETTISGGTAVSGLPVMNVIQINDTMTENVYINTTGLSGGGQLDNVALAFNWAEGAQFSGVIEHYSRSGIVQINGLQQIDVAEASVGGKVGPTDTWPMMDMQYTRIRRRSVDGVDFIYNTNTQRVFMNDCFIEGNFDILMPFCSGEVLINNSVLRSMPNDEAVSTIANQALSAVFTANDGLFVANNTTFWAGCYGAGTTYVVNLSATSDGPTVHTGCVYNFNNCSLIAEKVVGSTEVASTSFAFVNIESDTATINLNNTPFQFIGSPTPGASWRNFRSEPTVSATSQINVKGHGIMQGLSSATTFNVINIVDNNAVQTVAYSATITPNPNFGNRINVGALTGALTMAVPTNPQSGQVLDFAFLQDGTGGRVITWNAAFKKAADGAGTANQRGSTRFRYDGTNWIQQGGPLVYFA